MLKKVAFIFTLFPYLLLAALAPVTLLEIPLGDEEQFNYAIFPLESCSFRGVEHIHLSSFKRASNKRSVVEMLTTLKRKLNLEIDQQEISPDQISFSLEGSRNLSFIFTYQNCKLIKKLKLNERLYHIKKIHIDYNYALRSPVVEKIWVEDEENKYTNINIYPWQLQGQMSAYELNLGPAVNIHSNIRKNDQKKFQKSNPVIEPIPAFFFRYGPLFLNKDGLGSLLFHKNNFTIVGMGLLEGEPYLAPGLREREQGIFIGSIFKYHLLELTYYNDFFKNKGYTFKANLAPEFRFDLAWKFSPQLFVQYWDNDYVNYYFAVTSEESKASGFAPYSSAHTLNYGFMLETTHFIDRWTLVLSTGAKFYSKEIYRSPTVTKKDEFRLILSVLYKVF